MIWLVVILIICWIIFIFAIIYDAIAMRKMNINNTKKKTFSKEKE